MNDHRKYCAISKNGKYQVCMIGPCGDFRPMGNVREFDTFEEADKVAFDMSFGEYGAYPGEHISMR